MSLHDALLGIAPSRDHLARLLASLPERQPLPSHRTVTNPGKVSIAFVNLDSPGTRRTVKVRRSLPLKSLTHSWTE